MVSFVKRLLHDSRPGSRVRSLMITASSELGYKEWLYEILLRTPNLTRLGTLSYSDCDPIMNAGPKMHLNWSSFEVLACVAGHNIIELTDLDISDEGLMDKPRPSPSILGRLENLRSLECTMDVSFNTKCDVDSSSWLKNLVSLNIRNFYPSLLEIFSRLE